MKRTLNWVVNIILLWLLVIVFALFLLPRFGGWMFSAVLSGSMEPDLHVGGVVAIKPVEPGEISVGDIIAYRSGGIITTHRVIEVSGSSLVTKGDANEDADMSPVPASSVVGKVFFDLPYVGYLAAFVKTRLGILLAILLPGLAIIGLELKSLWWVVLGKGGDKAKAGVMPPLKVEKPALEHHSHTELQVPRLKTEKRWGDADRHSSIAGFVGSPLIDKIAIRLVIGGVAAVIAILATFFLMEVL